MKRDKNKKVLLSFPCPGPLQPSISCSVQAPSELYAYHPLVRGFGSFDFQVGGNSKAPHGESVLVSRCATGVGWYTDGEPPTPLVQGVHETKLENTLYNLSAPQDVAKTLTKLPCATFARSKGCPHLGQRMKCHKVPANPKPANLAEV